MEAVTIAIAAAGAVGAFLLKPVWAMITYLMVLFYYPQMLTLPLGTVEFSAGRIVVLGLMANALLRGNLRGFKFNIIDTWVLVQFIMMTIGFMMNVDAVEVLKGRGGQLFDTLMPYFAVRILISDRERLFSLIKWFTVGLVPLAILGIYEAKTGHNVYSPLAPYFSWGLAGPNADPTYMRHGLWRSSSVMGNYISFGMLFAGVAPLALGPMFEKNWGKGVSLVVLGGLLIGMISAMSSGPIFSIVVSFSMIALFRFRDKWPLFAMMVLAGLIFVEVFSNRHFYYVLTLFSFDPETAYYRIGLIEEAFGGGMSGHWFAGYGYVGVGPGNDNAAAGFNWEHQDLTNIYIHYMARAGLLALVPFLIVNYLYYRRLYEASKFAKTPSDAWMIWCLASMLVGWNISMQTVAALAQIETLLFMLIGLCANTPAIMRKTAEQREAGQAKPQAEGHPEPAEVHHGLGARPPSLAEEIMARRRRRLLNAD